MSKKMLIDAAHPEEVRVAVVSQNKIEDFDFESAARKPLRGNIFLARVTRVEPSLQAAFVDYGGNRHGFLAFSEIHPDYYQIPVSDRQALQEAEREVAELAAQLELAQRGDDEDDDHHDDHGDDDDRHDNDVAAADADDHNGEDESDEPADVVEAQADEAGEVDPVDAEQDVDAAADDSSDDDEDRLHAAPEMVNDDDDADADVEEEEEEEESKKELDADAPASDTDAAAEAPAKDAADNDAIEVEPAPVVEVVEAEPAAEDAPADEPVELEVVAEEDASDDAEEAPVVEEVVDVEVIAEEAEADSDDEGAVETPAEVVEEVSSDEDENAGDEDDDEADDEPANDEDDAPSSRRERDALFERYKNAKRKRSQLLRNYKIQEVIKRRQILLIQVVKEERGNKGAALTTYMSLAGRYCVLMPNTARGGGISRKIANNTDRRRLRRVVDSLEVPQGMGLIIRTAGAKRTKTEIKRDYDYLLRLWENIRSLTLKSIAPCLIYEEASLIKRAIRDLYDKDISKVFVEGEDGYREAKDFMKMLMPSHAKNVQPYKDRAPIFLKNGVETQLDGMYQPSVRLKSGGYIVIHQTEALVAIDVNSGRATRERNIEQTALKTNIEAAEEAARQFRLRDLAGLIVIDFIDMEEPRNNRKVERAMKDAMKADRARVQIGRISSFGLMELSRQRRRSGIVDGTTQTCPTCNGAGVIRSHNMAALRVLRAMEGEAISGKVGVITVRASIDVSLHVLNHHRDWINRIEERNGVSIEIIADTGKAGDDYDMTSGGVPRERRVENTVITADQTDPIEIEEEAPESEDKDEETRADGEDKPKRRRRRRRRKDRDSNENAENAEGAEAASESDEKDKDEPSEASAETAGEGEGEDDKPKKRRRRGRRGGRRNRRDNGGAENQDENAASADAPSEDEAAGETGDAEPIATDPSEAEQPDVLDAPAPLEAEVEAAAALPADNEADAVTAEAPAEEAPVPAEPEAETVAEEAVQTETVTEEAEPAAAAETAAEPVVVEEEAPAEPKQRKRRGWWNRSAS